MSLLSATWMQKKNAGSAVTHNFKYVRKLTLSSNESVAFKAPSGRPKGKQYLKK